MKTILVLAYAISPTRGSEYSVAWNYVTRMSKYNRLIVLYGVSGNYIGDCSEMENYLNNNSVPNVTFVRVEPNKLCYLLNWTNKHGFLIYLSYISYHIWHWLAYKKAKDIVYKNNIDLIHYLGPIGYREPGYLWKIDRPYMWGPISGTRNYPTRLSPSMNRTTRFRYMLRSCFNYWQLHHNSQLVKALNRCNVLLTATTETQKDFKNIYNKESVYIPENGITKFLKAKSSKICNDIINLIFIGRIDGRKNLRMAIDAVSKIKTKEKIFFTIVGEGPEKVKLQQYSHSLNFNRNIEWCGRISRTEVFNKLLNSDLLIITSLGEANSTVVFEAMSCGVPILTLDHCGMHDTICENCGFKIDIHQSYSDIVLNIAHVLDICVESPYILENKKYGIIDCAKQYTWEEREKIFLECYDKAINDYNKHEKFNQ